MEGQKQDLSHVKVTQELDGNEMNVLFQGLAELPARTSYVLMKKLETAFQNALKQTQESEAKKTLEKVETDKAAAASIGQEPTQPLGAKD